MHAADTVRGILGYWFPGICRIDPIFASRVIGLEVFGRKAGSEFKNATRASAVHRMINFLASLITLRLSLTLWCWGTSTPVLNFDTVPPPLGDLRCIYDMRAERGFEKAVSGFGWKTIFRAPICDSLASASSFWRSFLRYLWGDPHSPILSWLTLILGC